MKTTIPDIISEEGIELPNKDKKVSVEQSKEEMEGPQNPHDRVYRRRALPSYITIDEFTKVMQVAKKKHHKLAYALGFMSGLRVSEIVKLKKENIDLAAKRVFIINTKFKKDRVVPLPKGVPLKLWDLIPLKCGVRALQKAFKSDVAEAGIKKNLHFHSLRHGFATQCINKNIPLNQIQLLMGHSNISSTNVYLHANPVDALRNYEELF